MTNVNIMGIHQVLGEGGSHKKTIYMGNCLKREAWTICRGLAKNREKSVFEGGWSLDAHYDLIWYMPELKIGLADVSTLNFAIIPAV